MSQSGEVTGEASWYARALRLRHVRPGGLMSFLLFECMVAVAVLLGLAELTSWWAVAALPVAVAAMVKLNDVVAGALGGGGRTVPTRRDADELRPASGLAGAAGAGLRSSRVYVSGSYAAAPGGAVPGSYDRAHRMGETTTVRLPRESRPHENRRFDETTQHNGLQRRLAERPHNSRGRQQSAEVEAERAELVRPEWRQTVTLARHLRRDQSRAGNGWSAGPHVDAQEARHQGGQPNRHRFA